MEDTSLRYLAFVFIFLFSMIAANVEAKTAPSPSAPVAIQKQNGFFRFSYDNLKMPSGIERMGLLGVNYFADITPTIYAGFGSYAAVTGSQGGLFVLGIGGGLHHELFPNWWGDAGLFVGGGGGKSALVGGGLMVRPSIGIAYQWRCMRLGLHYSYINFPDGEIRSHQIGLDFDVPFDFYYVCSHDMCSLLRWNDLFMCDGQYFNIGRNDFGLLLQAYKQKSGTLNVNGSVQDGTIGLIGAELDHYLTERTFWWLKAGGAFHGIPNGYMDVIGGLGYHFPLGDKGFAVVPQLGAGAGGGGNVDTGGGILIYPELGFEVPLTKSFAGRLSGGYVWSPKGQLRAYTVTGEILYHLDMIEASATPVCNLSEYFHVQDWRLQILNQTYLRPQRKWDNNRSPDNLIALQLNQFISPYVFFVYQAASAYSGKYAGGLASGMIGPGLQSPAFFCQRARLFAEFLLGAAGGGSLSLGGGAVVEPIVGLNFLVKNNIGLEASVGQIKSLHNNLNTPVVNLGLTIEFGTLQRA